MPFPVQVTHVEAKFSNAAAPINTGGFGEAATAASETIAAMTAISTIPQIQPPESTAVNTTVYEPESVAATVDSTHPALPGFPTGFPVPPDMQALEQYASEFLTELKTWVDDTVYDGFDGLSPQTQTDMFNLDAESEAQQLFEKKDEAAAKWATSNWAMPDDVLTAATGNLERVYTQSKYKKSTEIRKKTLELAVKRMRFAVTEGLKVETALQTFTLAIQKIKAEIYGAQIEVFAAKVKTVAVQIDTLVKQYESRLEKLDAALATDIGNYTIARAANSVSARNCDVVAGLADRSSSATISALSQAVSIKTSAINAAAQAGGTLAAAYFSQYHAQTSVGYSVGNSDSISASNSTEYSTSNSVTYTEKPAPVKVVTGG